MFDCVVRIRLQRLGNKNRPFYRIIAADGRSPRDGRFIEILGHYNPANPTADFRFDEERVKHWLSHGARPSETVVRLLKSRGLQLGAES